MTCWESASSVPGTPTGREIVLTVRWAWLHSTTSRQKVVDAIATLVRVLKGQSQARRIVLVGHSRGATIAANILGRNPGLVEVALLIACACDDTKPAMAGNFGDRHRQHR